MRAENVATEKLCDYIETVKGFCYVDDRFNVSGSSEAAITVRARIEWVIYRECGEVLYSKRFSLRPNKKFIRAV